MRPAELAATGEGEAHEVARPQVGRALCLGVLTGLLLAAAALPADAKDLVGVYEDALRNDPQIRAADANRLASRESRPQALAALLPQITGTAAYTRDHNSGFQDEPFNVGGQFPVVQSTAANTERQWALNLRQNLFSWSNWM